ncbi:MAG: hypothetical protein OEZ13_08615 [Spirochaetia bacterium]|nr:hypothetical protein [Spirochaetia bacterium]
MKDRLAESLITLLSQGVYGSAGMLKNWAQMLFEIYETGLSKKIEDFQEVFKKSRTYLPDENLTVILNSKDSAIEETLENLYQKNVVKKIGLYDEYCLVDSSKYIFSGKNEDVFFIANRLELEPLHYFRARTQNYCLNKGISIKCINDIIIGSTEAVENAVKYSDTVSIAVKQTFVDHIYTLDIINTTEKINFSEEYLEKKYSEKGSLMRGVHIMNKLFDHVDIIREDEKDRVILSAKKSCS